MHCESEKRGFFIRYADNFIMDNGHEQEVYDDRIGFCKACKGTGTQDLISFLVSVLVSEIVTLHARSGESRSAPDPRSDQTSSDDIMCKKR